MTYEIEKEIPIPKLPEKRQGVKSALRIKLESMDIGDSVLVHDWPKPNISTMVSEIRRATKERFCVHELPTGIRVWRTE